MKDIFAQFEEQAKKVSLSSEEKQKIRGRLIVFTETNQATNQVTKLSSRETGKISKSRIFFPHLFFLKLRPMFIALVIALVLGGSTVAAAENTLPGDTLYPIKIHVNEQVRDAIEISAEKQAEWDLKKAERRLLEAQKLAQQGKLNAAVRSDIESRITENIDRVNKAKGDAENKQILAITLGSLLRAHSDILDSIVSSTSGKNGSRAELQLILNTLRQHTTTTVSTSTRPGATTSTSVFVEQAARGKLQAAEHKLAEVERFISKKWSGFTSTTSLSTTTVSLETKVKAKLHASRDLIAQGKIKLTAGLYREAFYLFQDSMNMAQEAKILVATAHELKINRRGDDRRDDRNTTSTDSRRQNDDADKKEDKDDDREKEDDSRGRSDSQRNNGESRGRGRN